MLVCFFSLLKFRVCLGDENGNNKLGFLKFSEFEFLYAYFFGAVLLDCDSGSDSHPWVMTSLIWASVFKLRLKAGLIAEYMKVGLQQRRNNMCSLLEILEAE